MTPLRFSALADSIRAEEPHSQLSAALTWIARLAPSFEKVGVGYPEPFERYRINRYLTKYTCPNAAPTANKTMVFCISGAAQRMMMPLANFLQHFDANSTDIVFLKYPRDVGYQNGLPELAGDFYGTLDKLERILDRQGTYARRVVMGTSAGALPALICGLRFQFEAVLAVGTGHPEDDRWAEATGGPGVPKIRMLAESARRTQIYLMFGKDCVDDVASANALNKLIPARLVAIGGTGAAMGHACLWPLAANGKLKEFLAATILKPDSDLRVQGAPRIQPE